MGARLKISTLWAVFVVMCLTGMRSYAVEFFEPLAYGESGSWVSPGVSPDDVCRRYAKLWRWDPKWIFCKSRESCAGAMGVSTLLFGSAPAEPCYPFNTELTRPNAQLLI